MYHFYFLFELPLYIYFNNHSYGRDLKWNPHIHVLISGGGLTNKTMKYKHITHFNYATLRKTFQRILLDKLYKRIGKSFYPIKCKLYKIHDNGFYVYAHQKQFSNIQKGIEYVMRYFGKPAMAESRIINIDTEKDIITINSHINEESQKF